MRKFFGMGLGILMVGGISLADTAVSPARPLNDIHLTVKKVKPIKLAKGGNTEATIEAEVAKKFHVQANPASMPNLIPTTLTLEPPAGFKAGNPVYPKPQPYKQRGTTTELQVYNGTFAVKIPIEADVSVKPGNYTVNGKLRYQACDETTCFPPVRADVAIPVTVH